MDDYEEAAVMNDYEEAQARNMSVQEYKKFTLQNVLESLTDEHRAHIRRWVDELRTGERVQTTGVLYHDRARDGRMVDCFCCLGVVAEINVDVIPQLRREGYSYIEETPTTLVRTYSVALPETVAALLGIDNSPVVWGDGKENSNGRDTPVNEVFELTELNDHVEWDFGRIADAIEKAYLTPASGGDNKENGEKE